MTKQHKHLFRYNGHDAYHVFFLCSCGERTSRNVTPAEAEWIKHGFDEWNHPLEFHKLFHAFCKQFMTPDYPYTFKYKGYKLMCKLEKFADKHSECILLSCDDNVHQSSDILLIPHQDKKKYWGTSIAIAPQDEESEPVMMFMYPREIQYALKALQKLDDIFHRKEPLRKQAEQEEKRQQIAIGFGLKPKEETLTDEFVQRAVDKAQKKFDEKYKHLNKRRIPITHKHVRRNPISKSGPICGNEAPKRMSKSWVLVTCKKCLALRKKKNDNSEKISLPGRL